jgi:amino acid adenylation domain-containing protein
MTSSATFHVPHLDPAPFASRESTHPTLRSGFLSSAARHPDAVALTIGTRAWTYAEAEHIARRWASRILDVSGGQARRVGVFGYRSETSYLGALASLFAGAAFVPLNRRFPVERTRAMLEQADVDALLVDADALSQVDEILRGLPRRPPVIIPVADTTATVPLSALPDVTPGDLAYLLFTSGSTGRPKGVPVTHGNVVHFLDVNQRRYQLTSADRLSQTFDQTFDLSIFDLFMAWGAGAAVCSLQPIELLAPFRFLERNKITVWFSVPSVAALMQRQNLLTPGSLPTLRWSLFCGEGLPRSTAEAWQAAAPQSVVENLYGPTELTIACSVYRWDRERSPAECVQDLVPIGRPYEGLSSLIVDGELCVGGPQTFPGYWRAPELTAERTFERDGVRYYRTGDVVRELPDGGYAYLGRTDHQVKIGGYRIELGEIEAVLRRAGCIEAAALPWPAAQGAEAIVAFVSGDVDVGQLAESVRRELPSYMVPRAIKVVEPMPLNANGKVDRAALRTQEIEIR